MKISIIIPCKNRLYHLLQCLPGVLNQTYQDLEVIIVDFNCPQNTGKVISEQFSDPRIKIFKAKVKKDHWNLSESRNAGFMESTGPILLFLDADTVVQPTFIEYAVKELNEKTFVTGLIAPPWNGCGCAMVNRADFVRVRGYNEALKGWGYEDFDFYKRMEATLEHRFFRPELIVNLQHDNSIRNEFHGGADIHENCKQNHEISQTTFKSRV